MLVRIPTLFPGGWYNNHAIEILVTYAVEFLLMSLTAAPVSTHFIPGPVIPDGDSWQQWCNDFFTRVWHYNYHSPWGNPSRDTDPGAGSLLLWWAICPPQGLLPLQSSVHHLPVISLPQGCRTVDGSPCLSIWSWGLFSDDVCYWCSKSGDIRSGAAGGVPPEADTGWSFLSAWCCGESLTQMVWQKGNSCQDFHRWSDDTPEENSRYNLHGWVYDVACHYNYYGVHDLLSSVHMHRPLHTPDLYPSVTLPTAAACGLHYCTVYPTLLEGTYLNSTDAASSAVNLSFLWY